MDELFQQMLEEVMAEKPDQPVDYLARRLAEERDSGKWPRGQSG